MEKAIIGLIGVVVGALLTTMKDFFFYRKSRKEEQIFLCIRITSFLDKFASICIEVVFDDGLTYGQRNEDGTLTPTVTTPVFDPFIADVNWKCIPANLLYKIMQIPSEVENANGYIDSVWMHSCFPPDNDELFEARAVKYAELGIEAISLSKALRTLAGLPAKQYNEWNGSDRLKGELKKIEETQRIRSEKSIETHKNMLASIATKT